MHSMKYFLRQTYSISWLNDALPPTLFINISETWLCLTLDGIVVLMKSANSLPGARWATYITYFFLHELLTCMGTFCCLGNCKVQSDFEHFAMCLISQISGSRH